MRAAPRPGILTAGAKSVNGFSTNARSCMSREKATQVMLQVHREGMGVCGTYTREIASTKVEQVIDLARKHQHPLQCTMEET